MAAPVLAAASTTAATSRGSTSGRAASWTRTRSSSLSNFAARNARATDSRRVTPPSTSVYGTGASASAFSNASSWPGETAITADLRRPDAASRSSVCRSIGLPRSGTSAFGPPSWKRAPNPAAGISAVARVAGAPCDFFTVFSSPGENFRFLGLQDTIHFGDALVRQLLDLVEGALLVVRRDRGGLRFVLDGVVPLVAVMADLDFRVLGKGMRLLDDVLAALFRGLRDGNAHDLSVRGGIEAEIARPDRLLDDRAKRRLPGDGQDERGVRRGKVRDLVHGGHRAVVVHEDSLEDPDGRAARPQVLQLGLERVKGRVHAALGFLLDLGNRRHGSRLLPVSGARSGLRGFDDASDCLAQNDATNVARHEEVEDADGHLVVPAEGDRGGVHHSEPLFEHVLVGDARQEDGRGVLLRIGGIDAVHARCLQDDLGTDLVSAERGRRVRREVRVAGPAREDDAALLLEVTNRPPPDERLGDRAHLERRLVARDPVDALRRGRDAPDDVSAADDDGQLHSETRDFRDLVGHARDHRRLDAEGLAAEERLPGEFQQDPAVAGFHVLT